MTFIDPFPLQQYGPFDLIIDDGSHLSAHMKASFEALYNTKCLKDGSVYVIEDTHAVVYHRWFGRIDESFRYDKDKDVYDMMGSLARGMVNYDVMDCCDPPAEPTYSKHIHSMVTYDSLIFFHFQENWKPIHRFRKGKFIPYG